MVAHSDLTGSDLHEPKGVDNASANKVYLSDGQGSGSWVDVPQTTGWCQYTDSVFSSDGASELTITDTGVGTKITCNNNTAIETQAPSDMVEPLWDSSNNKFNPINEGDYYLIRLTFDSSTFSGTINYVTLNLDIGDGVTPNIIWSKTFLPYKGVGQKFSFTIPVYVGTNFVQNNGSFYLLKNGSGSFAIQDISFSILRAHKG